MLWDSAPYHRAATVTSEAKTLEIGLQRLPLIVLISCLLNTYGNG